VTHPLVADAAVVEQRGDGGDSRLRAYIVTRTSSSTAADDLRTHLRHSVPDYMVPASFEIVEALPRTASGKVNRPVLEACAEAPEAAATAAAQRLDPTETRLTQIWEDLLGRRPLPAAADFFDSGGDSLLAARLSVAIERAFGVRLPLSTFVAARTVRAQAQVLRTAGRQTEWPSLIPLRSTGSRPPIFFFHLIDGDVLGYRDLARHLPADQPVYGLQSRGLDGISRINTRIEDMAHDYVREIRARFPTGPYALCGWSYGGRVAFEVARQLEQEGQHVALLALLDSRLPLPQDRTLRMHLEGQVHRKFAHLRALVRGPARLAYAGAIVRRRWESASQCVGRMLVLWQRRGGWLPRSLRSVVRANRCARHDYVPTPYGGRITLFKATDRWDAALGDPFGRWTALAGGGISIHEVPGTHGSMIREPLVRTLAEGLAQCLDAAWARAVIDRKCDDRVA
jgi:thioesterase domain-containing protein/acyl carrier protein